MSSIALGIVGYALPTLQETFPQIDWARDGAFRDVPADAPWQVWADRLIERQR
jgi:hypothetical protein